MTSTTTASAVAPPLSSPMPVPYRRYALGLLVAIYTVNFLDRQIVTILIPDIKRDLNLSDSEVGAMAGLWFAILYTTLGIPIARWADRGDRPFIMTASLAVWSGFTVLAGFAQNFLMLAISRAGVGVGEAGCTPTAHSLLTDYFPKESRARAGNLLDGHFHRIASGDGPRRHHCSQLGLAHCFLCRWRAGLDPRRGVRDDAA